jgi:hypothetical protein
MLLTIPRVSGPPWQSPKRTKMNARENDDTYVSEGS